MMPSRISPPSLGDPGAAAGMPGEGMGEAVCVCDGQGRVILANPAAEAMFGDRHPATYDELMERFEPTHDVARADPRLVPVELRRADRPERWVELRVYDVLAETGRAVDEGETAGRIAVMRDVTAVRHARAQREVFLGMLSHELRTPMTTIYAGAQLLARDESLTSATMRELASDVGAEAERLFRLVEDVLVLTRAERDALDLAHEPVLVHRVVTTAVRQEEIRWPDKEFVVDAAEDVPAATGDTAALGQVLHNLLSHAARYGPPGGAIEIAVSSSGSEVSVRVLDCGRAFARVEGIGPLVCRQLVDAMHGRIWMLPREGGGSELGFALRVYREGA